MRICALCRSCSHMLLRELAENFDVSYTAILHHLKERPKIKNWTCQSHVNWLIFSVTGPSMPAQRAAFWLAEQMRIIKLYVLERDTQNKLDSHWWSCKTSAKFHLHLRNLIICVWLDVKGAVHWEIPECTESFALLYGSQAEGNLVEAYVGEFRPISNVSLRSVVGTDLRLKSITPCRLFPIQYVFPWKISLIIVKTRKITQISKSLFVSR